MVMKFATLEKAVTKARADAPAEAKVLLMSPQEQRWTTINQSPVCRALPELYIGLRTI